jgi:hypothetical protein
MARKARRGGHVSRGRSMRTAVCGLLMAIALVPVAGVGTAAAQTATVQVTNHGTEPLFLNATYSTLKADGATSGPQTIQPGATQTYSVEFQPLDFDPGQVWLFRWGGSNAIVGVAAVFGSSGGQDVQCGWTDVNAGYDGNDLVPWQPGCQSTTQSGTGDETIIGTAEVYDPPTYDDSYEVCTANDPPWANASDTGVQFNVANSQWQTLNLVWALVAEDEGDTGGLFPPPIDGADASARRAQSGPFGPPLGANSPLADTWQYPPLQFIGGNSTGVDFCAYDETTAIGGDNTGTYMTVLYQIGSTDAYLYLYAGDPFAGSNQVQCEITDVSGNPLTGTPYDADCGIQHGQGIHSVWHAVAWVTLWETGGSSKLRSANGRPSEAIARPRSPSPAGAASYRAPKAFDSARRVVATVRRKPVSGTAYRTMLEHRAAAARSSALMRLTGDTTHDECTRAVAAHPPPGTRNPAARARRFCAPVRRPAPMNKRAVRREAFNALILGRWIALEARRRGVRVRKAQVDRRMAALRSGAGRSFSALMRAARLSRGELRSQVRTTLLATRLGLVSSRPGDVAQAVRAVRRLYDRWRPRTRCRPRFFVRTLCGRRLTGDARHVRVAPTHG